MRYSETLKKHALCPKLLFLILMISISSNVYSQEINLLGKPVDGTDDSLTSYQEYNQTLPPPPPVYVPLQYLPPAVDYYFVDNKKPITPIYPVDGEASFEPPVDTAVFDNFSSLSWVNPGEPNTTKSKTQINMNSFNSGTCYGVSFFTGLWYKEIIRPYQRAAINGDAYSCEGVSCSLSQIQEEGLLEDIPDTGIEVVVAESQNTLEMNRLPFTEDHMSQNLATYRLKALSDSSYKNAIMRAMIGHHQEHFASYNLELLTGYGYGENNTSNFDYHLLEERLKNDGVAVVEWYIYKMVKVPGHKDLVREFDTGHSCLAYACSEVSAQARNRKTNELEVKKAIRVDFYDPNTILSQDDIFDSAQGYGTYFLYFPESKKASFSGTYCEFNNLQQKSVTVDGELTKLCLNDVLSSANLTRFLKDAKTRYCGFDGKILNDETSQKLKDLQKEKEAEMKVLKKELDEASQAFSTTDYEMYQLNVEEARLYDELSDVLEESMVEQGLTMPLTNSLSLSEGTESGVSPGIRSSISAQARARYEEMCQLSGIKAEDNPTRQIAQIDSQKQELKITLSEVTNKYFQAAVAVDNANLVDIDDL